MHLHLTLVHINCVCMHVMHIPDITFTVAGALLSLNVEVKSHHQMVVCRVVSGGCPFVASGLKAASWSLSSLLLKFLLLLPLLFMVSVFSSPQVPSPSPIAVHGLCLLFSSSSFSFSHCCSWSLSSLLLKFLLLLPLLLLTFVEPLFC